ncbi:MAG: hypothetical protein WAP56_09220 [Acetivibrionales bacterium]|nr:hypothetical protein [Bacillota bacterium]NLP06867.1 hypothetical protein [Clostridiaceae bacterium]HOA56258.1 hypothetical protein [Clostridiales bacterium]HPZ05782.1 hypothetical protein [Clostridiales bacterium]HQD32269.1 hypothetical protein [Clostridiales bacterium]
MKKLAVIIICVLLLCTASFIIFRAVNINTLHEFLGEKYPDQSFTIESVDINLLNMEITARIKDSDEAVSMLRKKGSTIYSDYEHDKAKSVVKNELSKVMRESGLTDHVNHFDVSILEKVEYAEIAGSMDPVIHLTIEYNDTVSGKRDFAEKSHDVIRVIRGAKYNNIGTYVFLQSGEHDVLILEIYSEDSGADVDTLLNRIEVVKETEIVQ